MATALSSATPATPSPSFLARCREDLSPDKPANLDWWSKTYYYAFAGGGFVLYVTAAVTAFVAASILFPAYAPMVALTALLFAFPAAEGVKKLLHSSDQLGKEANKYRSIQNHYTQIAGQSLLQTQADLMSRGIVWYQIPGIDISHPENLASLHPLLARAKYLDDKIRMHLSHKNQLTAQARDLANADFNANREKVYDLRVAALESGDQMIKAKVEAAFANAILRKGDYNGTLADIASVSTVNFIERAFGHAVNDTTGVNHCLTFRNRNFAPISFDEVKAMDPSLLGHRLAAAMA